MKYFDAFSGYGGFSLGIQRAYDNLRPIQQESDQRPAQLNKPENELQQWQCVGYSEINKYAIQVYSKHFPTHKNYGDITKINSEELPDFDLFVGGFPCQAFSIAGKRAGFEDTRGTLIYDVLRIVKEKHPKFVLLENVKGLLSHDSGRTFKTIITALAELGYDVEWQVLNAKNFGVPQNRERVFIIGHLGGFGGRQVFPLAGDDSETSNLNYVGAIMSERNKQWLEDGKLLSRNFPQGQRVYATDGISATLASQAGGLGAKTGLYMVDDPSRKTGLVDKNIAPTLRTETHGNLPSVLKDARVRRLTPTECERLMGLPDGWTKGVSDTQRYKLCGNGVVVNVVEEIVKRLAKY